MTDDDLLAFLRECSARGVTLTPDGEALRVLHPDRLNPQDLELLKQHKGDVLRLLLAEAPPRPPAALGRDSSEVPAPGAVAPAPQPREPATAGAPSEKKETEKETAGAVVQPNAICAAAPAPQDLALDLREALFNRLALRAYLAHGCPSAPLFELPPRIKEE
jgi:hypothetical protein